MPWKPAVSVLMPSYNDARYITNSIRSLQEQRFEDWELIIVDGSTDDTPQIVDRIKESRIRYFREERAGQLNALYLGTSFINGKYVMLLHSDDELVDHHAISRNVEILEKHECDGVFGDLIRIDGEGRAVGRIRTAKGADLASAALVFLTRGNNVLSDFFFVKRRAFENVISSYLTWNTPYWIRFLPGRLGFLDLMKIEPFYKYRIYEENYIRSEVGRFEALNGALRSVLELGKRLNIPLPELQRDYVRGVYKVINSFPNPLFHVERGSDRNLRRVVLSTINEYYWDSSKNPYMIALNGFYDNYPSERKIDLKLDGSEVFCGRDARHFFNVLKDGRLSTFHQVLLEEASKGFGEVTVKSREEGERVAEALRFLNLMAEVKIH